MTDGDHFAGQKIISEILSWWGEHHKKKLVKHEQHNKNIHKLETVHGFFGLRFVDVCCLWSSDCDCFANGYRSSSRWTTKATWSQLLRCFNTGCRNQISVSIWWYVCMCICLLVCLLAWLFDCLLAWLVGCLFVYVFVCLFTCKDSWMDAHAHVRMRA